MASFKPVLKYIFPCVRLYCKLNKRDAQRNHVADKADMVKLNGTMTNWPVQKQT